MEEKSNVEESSAVHNGELNADSSTPIREENQSNTQPTSNTIPILTNYEGIQVPYIFTRDLESYENKGWREPNIRISDYFNYGLNEETWEKYSKIIFAKFPALKKAIKDNRLQLPDKSVEKYVYNFPADYGGLGEILDEQKYDKLNLFEHKLSKNKTVPWLEVKHGLVYVPLESRNENLNINYNPSFNVNNSQSINPNISHEPSTHQPAFNPLNIPPQYFPFYRPPIDSSHSGVMASMMNMPYPMMIRPGMPMPYIDHSQSTRTKSKDESESESDSESSRESKRRKHKKEKKKKHKRSRSRSRNKKHSKSKKSRSRSRRKKSSSKNRKERKKSRV